MYLHGVIGTWKLQLHCPANFARAVITNAITGTQTKPRDTTKTNPIDVTHSCNGTSTQNLRSSTLYEYRPCVMQLRRTQETFSGCILCNKIQ
jgi:hypothetical protein